MTAASMGPEVHSKHVCVVLITLTTRVKGGIICSETCTQEVQSFHHVTNHTGPSVDAQYESLPWWQSPACHRFRSISTRNA